MKSKLLFIAFFSFLMAGVDAQSLERIVICTSGTYESSANYSMTWTIGEVMTDTYSSASNFFTQGFNQPDTSFVTAVANLNPSENISVYPNPAINYFEIDFKDPPGHHIIYMYNGLGQMLLQRDIPAGQQTIRISLLGFANGLYLLNIISPESNLSSSFKISKTQ